MSAVEIFGPNKNPTIIVTMNQGKYHDESPISLTVDEFINT